MACPCTSYIRVATDACNEFLVLTGVEADETGVWAVEIEFNGRLKCSLSVGVTLGLPVQIPNVLNEAYTHEMRLYRSNGSLVGCYWIGGPTVSQTVSCGGFLISEIGEPILSEAGLQITTE